MAHTRQSSRTTPSTARPRQAAPLPKPMKPQSPPPVVKDDPIKVRVKEGETGYYDHVRRRAGDVFIIANRRAFSKRWMEEVNPRTPERVSTATSALREQHDAILGGRAQERRPSDTTGDEDVLGD